MNRIAIVVVAYNRLDSVSRLLRSLENAYYDDEVTLIISIDKSDTDIVERYALDYQWNYGKKIVDLHEQNLGLRNHMLSLGKWFDFFDAIVVLEDDIVVAESFFLYTKQCVDKYYNNYEIAGIGLYSYNVNYLNNLPFQPQKSIYDVYLWNNAISWGEVWMKKQWSDFYEWYKEHLEFPQLAYLPERFCNMGKNSWLKYHTRYCIENNKYFVVPYNAFSSNFDDIGTHNVLVSAIYQVPLVHGKIGELRFPKNLHDAVRYNGFLENKSIYENIGFTENECSLDLNGCCRNYSEKRYWLTTKKANYKIIKSYGLKLRPIEDNVINNITGSSIFVYDLNCSEKNDVESDSELLLYNYHMNSMIMFVRRYGLYRLFNLLISHYFKKFFNYITK